MFIKRRLILKIVIFALFLCLFSAVLRAWNEHKYIKIWLKIKNITRAREGMQQENSIFQVWKNIDLEGIYAAKYGQGGYLKRVNSCFSHSSFHISACQEIQAFLHDRCLHWLWAPQAKKLCLQTPNLRRF